MRKILKWVICAAAIAGFIYLNLLIGKHQFEHGSKNRRSRSGNNGSLEDYIPLILPNEDILF
ncbi:MAG: hypothetical protein ACYSUB_23125 [Planctomycetota bacterium]|jgi:hypothetical protein